jgi:peptide/nickel transport system ATP-binding protein
VTNLSPATALTGDAASDRSHLLNVEQLSIEYLGVPRVLAVDGVSLSVERGERVGIVGESGSGKSTLVNALVGFVEPPGRAYGGGIWFDGVDLLQAAPSVLRTLRGKSIGMIFQDPLGSLNPVYTVGRQVLEAIQVHSPGKTKGELTDKARSLLAEVGVPEVARRMNQYPHEFSGGMCQRVAIAMALANDPSLVIADEPTSSLDVTTQRSVLELLLRESEERSASTIIVTHDLGVVSEFAQRVVVMYAGVVMEEGPVRTVFHQPQHPYTRALLDAIPRLDDPRSRRLNAIPGALPRPGDVVPGCPFEPRCFVGNGREICRTVRPLPTAVSEEVSVACHFPQPRPGAPPSVAQTDMPDQVNARLQPALQVVGLTKRFRLGKSASGRQTTFTAVDDVSFSIATGEFLGLVGESGSGKTTLARMILGLTPVDGGSLRFRGEPLRSGKRGERAGRVQAVFQDPGESLNPRMTVRSIVAEPIQLARGSPAQVLDIRVRELLEQVSVGVDRATAHPGELSGGQRQRVAIARAIATKPPVLVFDEAVSNLDVSVRAQVLNLINDLRAELGVSALFITHDLSVARRVCDRVLVMYRGKIVETANADELFLRPRHPYSINLIASVPSADPDHTTWRASDRSPRPAEGDTLADGCAYAPLCPRRQEKCWQAPPELLPENGDHRVACYFPEIPSIESEPGDRDETRNGPATG